MNARIASAAAAALLFATAVGATYGVAFATDVGRRADARIFSRIGRGDQSELRTDLRKLGQRIGGHKLNVVAAGTVAVAAVALAVMSMLGRMRLRAPLVLLLVGASFATTELIKPLLGEWGRELAPFRLAINAFPSGHATLAMAIVLACVMAAPTRRKVVIAICAATVATVLGLLIVVGGLHPPSDVVGGYFVAGAWASLLSPFVRRPRTARRPDTPPAHRVLTRFGIGAIALACLAFAAAVGIYVEDIFGAHRTLVFLITGLTAVSTVVVGVAATLADLGERDEIAALRYGDGEVSERPKERDWKSRTC